MIEVTDTTGLSPEEINLRFCKTCETFKAPDRFSRARPLCKECQAEAARKFRAAHPCYDKRIRNTPKHRAQQQRYRDGHRTYIQQENKRQYEKNKPARVASQAIYNAKKRAENKAWRLANQKHLSAYGKGYRAKRYKTDPMFRLTMRLRNRVRQALKLYGAKKCARTVELIGCPVTHARAHIESLFKPGMSWSNHGKFGWHIDHVKAIIHFDLSNPEQQRAAFHWSNLQPLWWWENLSKGDKIAA